MPCIQIKDEDWFYCTGCEEVAIACKACGFSSCSGCGCKECTDRFNLATWLVETGRAPRKENLPIHDSKKLLDELFKES